MITRTFEITVAQYAGDINGPPTWSQPIETYRMALWYGPDSELIGRCIARHAYRQQYGIQGPLWTRVTEVES